MHLSASINTVYRGLCVTYFYLKQLGVDRKDGWLFLHFTSIKWYNDKICYRHGVKDFFLQAASKENRHFAKKGDYQMPWLGAGLDPWIPGDSYSFSIPLLCWDSCVLLSLNFCQRLCINPVDCLVNFHPILSPLLCSSVSMSCKILLSALLNLWLLVFWRDRFAFGDVRTIIRSVN